ncbi:LOG family protein [Legionella cardiaca]|uniref:LOG family protein n=1 Tax=Legionella cardiaca TaxID=1071983 RepID=UPI0030841794
MECYQDGVLDKPIGFLNINGYFDGLFSFIESAENQGFLSGIHAKIPKINTNPALLISELLTCNLLKSEVNVQ